MLRNTFCHIPGVSAAYEAELWLQGVHSWEQLREHATTFPSAKRETTLDHLTASERNLQQANMQFFSRLLPSRLHWRLFPVFRKRTAYLDIETTGLSRYRDHITTIALFDGDNIRYYVQGQNLESFREDITAYELLVTYNGKAFDIPFIESALQISLPQLHIDLMHLLRGLGFKGGLKGCEKQLGVVRCGLEGVDGRLAVALWREYQSTGNVKALETLLAYNIEDALNLETLMIEAYNLKLRETPFLGSNKISLPKRPQVPFEPDRGTISRLMSRL
jgi:uncharacterized protein YprB with RNaseH-like and TPR domain